MTAVPPPVSPFLCTGRDRISGQWCSLGASRMSSLGCPGAAAGSNPHEVAVRFSVGC